MGTGTMAARGRPLALAVSLLLAAALPLGAQDFGFGLDAEGAGSAAAGSLAVSIGGEVGVSLIGFVEDFADGAAHTQLGDLFSGKLKLSAETSRAAGVISVKIAPGPVYYGEQSPVYVDEAYVRVYFGALDIEGGLRKLTWGRADSLGPLDVVNPLDYSDLSDLSDMLNLKIARPLLHASLHLGSFSKLEALFVPGFEPVRFAETGPWAPGQAAFLSQLPPENIIRPDTRGVDYAQAGLRFTTTIGGAADIGAQYYYGRLTSPALTMTAAMPPVVSFAYNPYHQIGVDWAQVIAGFNLRAEAAANLTEDLGGSDIAVYNPSLAWSLGFDRDLFWGLNLNLQCSESIRLLDGKIESPQDIEAGSGITSTQITVQLSKRFLRDELELKAAALWEIEDKDCFVMPGIVWTKDDAAVELSGGVFVGGSEGLFGQFHDNSFVKAALSYSF